MARGTRWRSDVRDALAVRAQEVPNKMKELDLGTQQPNLKADLVGAPPVLVAARGEYRACPQIVRRGRADDEAACSGIFSHRPTSGGRDNASGDSDRRAGQVLRDRIKLRTFPL